MKTVGYTKKGSRVVSGIFNLFDSSGLPLIDCFNRCIDHDLTPSWIHFYHEASRSGWKHKTIMNRLKDALDEVYGIKYRDVVLNKLQFCET